jgi:hypothetical protein
MDTQREALERTIKAGVGILTDKHAALLALCRELAGQMDDAGYEAGPSTRLSAAYLSALKDLGRALAVPVVKERAGGKLSQLRGIQGGVPVPAGVPARRRKAGA